MSSGEVVTKTEYARMRGVSDRYVRKLARKGRLALTDDGRVKVADSDALVAATRDPSRGGKRAAGALGEPGRAPSAAWQVEAAPAAAPAPAPASAAAAGQSATDGTSGDLVHAASYAEAQRLHKLEQIRRMRLVNARDAGALVLADEVKRIAASRARQAQSALMGIPDRLCLSLAAEADPDRCHALLLAEIRNVCAELAGSAAPRETGEVAA